MVDNTDLMATLPIRSNQELSAALYFALIFNGSYG